MHVHVLCVLKRDQVHNNYDTRAFIVSLSIAYVTHRGFIFVIFVAESPKTENQFTKIE